MSSAARHGETCLHHGAASPFRLLGAAVASPAPPLAAAPAHQRAKLWDLSGSIHCSIIGTCLTTAELRRAMGRFAKRDINHLTDHDLHSEAVGWCGHHNACSKLLNKTLDQRHHIVIRQFAKLRGEAAVMQKWREARQAGDIPGTYWAVLTHPDVGASGIREAFGDVHMLSHLIGSANRADIRRLAVLETEKAELLGKVERQQARLCEAVTSREATIRRLSTLAAGKIVSSSTDDNTTALRDVVRDLQARLASETGRRERLEARLAEAAEAAQSWERQARLAGGEKDAVLRELQTLEGGVATLGESNSPTRLPAECVLYVGGRPGAVEQARDALAAAGGELIVHDGGKHDNPSQLAGLIGRADRVVFPVDCVSHDAALTVKRLCRQSGKPWLPLRSSGVASFLSALTDAAVSATNSI